MIVNYYLCKGGSGGMLPPPKKKKIDKNSAIWCIPSVPKLVIINLKINNFYKSTTQTLCQIFLQDQSRRTLWHKNKYIHIKGGSGGGGGGLKKMLKLKKCKKWRLYVFHTRRKDVSCNDVDSDPC